MTDVNYWLMKSEPDAYSIDSLKKDGITLWVFGFMVEVMADSQKRQFRKDPKNKGRFINTGLWSWSQHPNYFGEITL